MKKRFLNHYKKSKHLGELSKKTGLSINTLKNTIKKLNLQLLPTTHSYEKQKKESKILVELLKNNATYKEIGEKYNVSIDIVIKISKKNQLSRNKTFNKEELNIIYNKILLDIDNGVTYNDLKIKYNLNHYLLQKFKRCGFDNLRTKCINIRNQIFEEQYINKTANEIMKSNEPKKLLSPKRIESLIGIYGNISYRKYPKIGRRDLGGTFLDRKILRYILVKRKTTKLSFRKISDKLNELGYRTSTNKPFTYYLVNYYYNSYQNKKNKRLKY